jgi:murein DD-endopeptidase MepM/ murein hydrolase activator NlpD
MPYFPLPFVPSLSWHKGSGDAYFGAGRPNDPRMGLHAACDLAAPAGTKVYAIDDGMVIRGPYKFVEYYNQDGCHSLTYALEVQHYDFIARYCEISAALPQGIERLARIDAGTVIATVGQQCGGTMLHLEMFRDVDRLGSLNDNPSNSYRFVPKGDWRRRDDLIDPTPYLDAWVTSLPPT